MRRYVADLHVHSVLSPCAEVEMTPRNIVYHAVEYGIDIIAITDHNSCDNVAAAIEAAKGTGITVLPGMEIETKEEIHVIVLFDTLQQMNVWETYVISQMSGRLNDESRFGAQFVVDAEDELICVKPELLISSLKCGIAEVTSRVAAMGGICIASHVDRPAYSIISQLGFIPTNAVLTAVEVSCRMPPYEARQRIPAIGQLPVVSSSDAHMMEQFIGGPKTVFYIEQPNLSEICMALGELNMRKMEYITSCAKGGSE